MRAVGTNTLRVAKNGKEFLARAEAALGFPIEVVAGREEARLIYLGVAHSLPVSGDKRLVVDIGGGSTEFIIGSGYKPRRLESLYMGCVSWTLRFFPAGKISKSASSRPSWPRASSSRRSCGSSAPGTGSEAVGSSGTARTIGEILQARGWTDGSITPDGLERLRAQLLKAGDVARLDFPGIKPDRLQVLPGGFAIMSAVFAELKVARMMLADRRDAPGHPLRHAGALPPP